MAETQRKIREAEQAGREAAFRLKMLNKLDSLFTEGDMAGVRLDSIQVKYTPDGDSDYLVIGKGRSEDGRPKVVFSPGDTAQNALLNMLDRAEQRGIKWRDDKPWKPAE